MWLGLRNTAPCFFIGALREDSLRQPHTPEPGRFLRRFLLRRCAPVCWRSPLQRPGLFTNTIISYIISLTQSCIIQHYIISNGRSIPIFFNRYGAGVRPQTPWMRRLMAEVSILNSRCNNSCPEGCAGKCASLRRQE